MRRVQFLDVSSKRLNLPKDERGVSDGQDSRLSGGEDAFLH